jgi:hypothetical protein
MASISDARVSLADNLVEDLEGYQEEGRVVSAYVIDEWVRIDNIFDNGDQYVIWTVFEKWVHTTIVSAEQIKGVRYTRVEGEL